MSQHGPTLRTPLTALSGLFLLCSAGFIVIFSSALGQEPDTLAILRAVLQLRLNRNHAVAVNNNPQRLLVLNNNALKQHLEAQGWRWIDQLGAGSTYRQNSQELNATCSMYSRHFMICDLKYD